MRTAYYMPHFETPKHHGSPAIWICQDGPSLRSSSGLFWRWGKHHCYILGGLHVYLANSSGQDCLFNSTFETTFKNMVRHRKSASCFELLTCEIMIHNNCWSFSWTQHRSNVVKPKASEWVTNGEVENRLDTIKEHLAPTAECFWAKMFGLSKIQNRIFFVSLPLI